MTLKGKLSNLKSRVVFWKPTESSSTKIIPSNIDCEQETVNQGGVISDIAITCPKSLWDEAYERLRAENPHVVYAYEELLRNILIHQTSKLSTDLESILSDPAPNIEAQEHVQQSNRDRKQMMEAIIDLGQIYMEENKIAFKIGEQEFSLRDQMETAVAGIQVGKDWIDEAVKASPLASTVWAGVSLLLPLLTNPIEVQAANEEGLAYVSQKIRYYTNMETRLLREQSEALPSADKQLYADRFIELYQAIIDYQAQSVLRLFRRRFESFLRDATKWDSWEDMLKRIKELGDNLEKESLQFNSISSSRSLAALTRRAEESADDKCLQCFYRGDYVWYKNRIEDRVSDTCLWFLNHTKYHSWLEADCGPLLVSADPGCGKSVLTKYLVDSNFGFQVPKETAICYFFFKEGDQNTIDLAFCALIHQLLCLRPKLMHHAVQKYKEKGDKLANNPSALWSILQAATADPQAGAVIIVIDALDECLQDEYNMGTLAQNIRTHFEKGPKTLKVLMTSRPYQNTTRHIQELEDLYQNIRIHGEDESEFIRKEINLVIEYRISRMKKFSNHREHLKARLLDISHRTYLWVYLVFSYLEDSDIKNTAKGLDAAIQNLPARVEDAYEKILSRSRRPETTKKALFILLGAYRPLTIREMQVALEMNVDITSIDMLDLESDETFYLRLRELCGLFVTKHDEKLYFLHQTAREFLLTASSSTPGPSSTLGWAHRFSLQQAHMILAESCVQYLDCLTSRASVYSTAITPETVDFLKYSTKYWPKHFREADVPDGASIVASAVRICEPDMRASIWYKYWDNRFLRSSNNWSSLTLASAFGHAAVVRLLLVTTALQSNHSSRALYEAVRYNREEIVKLLLATDGVDVNLQDEYGRTPLAWAVRRRRETVIKLLLATDGVDVNLQDRNGWTPLHYAIHLGNTTIVQSLLETGRANVDLKNEDGYSPLSLAKHKGQDTIAKLLERQTV
ncbi:hypothetical protein RRF57_008906 [Xylaria bambusicola]|uniref:NWD NACHT-NTPase N-terminal domain-containing protein n=1 Tax=Xylaria bambusicola TaxID=326684 RepID=A0AAN7UQ46_9PEZI